MADRLDILIFGATGFTGRHCIPYLAKLSNQNGRHLSWGVAGRSAEKLKRVLKEVEEKIGANFDDIPVVVADLGDHKSLVDMAKRARLVLNSVGPFLTLGEAVVKACIEAGTHHIDMSGEPEYMERMQLEQHDAAVEKGVYVVSACGLDSIPIDIGVLYLQQHFEGTLNSVKTYLKIWLEGPLTGPFLSYGTFESVVHSAANTNKLKDTRNRFYQKYKKAPTYKPVLKDKVLPHKSDVVEGWVLPFLGADGSVAERTQNYMYEHENKRPVQISTYFTLSSFARVLIYMFFGGIGQILVKFNFGKNLILNHPSGFSGGFFTKEPLREEIIDNAWFSIDFYGEGCKEKLANKDDQYTTPIDRIVRTRITGNNPAYGATCLMVVLAGITILTETEKVANKGKGGVYPPGAAFAKTSLIKQLNENGIVFEVISQQDI